MGLSGDDAVCRNHEVRLVEGNNRVHAHKRYGLRP